MSLEHTLKKLISYRTITGNREVAEEAFQWIKDELQPVPVYVRELEHNGFPALVITTKRTKKPKLMLAAHIDVVEGSDAIFEPKVKQGKLFGRGAYDMKFAIACYVELLKELGMGVREHDLGVMLTSDEEVAGYFGTRALLAKDSYRPKLAFLPDGGGAWHFEEWAKGMWTVKAIARGESAHGSRPWHGSSAIRTLTDFLQELYEAFDRHGKKAKDDHWHATLNVGTIEGGYTFNQVPDYAEATLDIRVVSQKERRDIERLVKRLAKKYRGMVLETIFEEPDYGIGRGNGDAKCFAKIAKEKYGIKVDWARSHGSSDARFFAQHKIPTLLIQPKAGGGHSEHEWIDLKDLERFYEVLKEFVKQTA